MELQQPISLRKNQQQAGRRLEVLAEGVGEVAGQRRAATGCCWGAAIASVPEVDGSKILGLEGLPAGEMLEVVITGYSGVHQGEPLIAETFSSTKETIALSAMPDGISRTSRRACSGCGRAANGCASCCCSAPTVFLQRADGFPAALCAFLRGAGIRPGRAQLQHSLAQKIVVLQIKIVLDNDVRHSRSVAWALSSASWLLTMVLRISLSTGRKDSPADDGASCPFAACVSVEATGGLSSIRTGVRKAADLVVVL